MGWGIAVAALISAGGAYASSSSASGASEDAAAQQQDYLDEYNAEQEAAQAERDALIAGADESVFGSIPEPVDYEALYEDGGYIRTQGQTIKGNTRNLDEAVNLSNLTNQAVTASNKNRIESWLPGFTGNLQLGNTQAGSLLAGNVPADVAQAIASQTAGNEATLGTAGTSGADMNRNLGLTSLQNIQSGMAMLGNLADITGQVDPLSMQMLPQSMFINPSDAIQWQIGERESQYASNVNNSLLAAAADPTAAGQFQLNYANTTPTTALSTSAAPADNSAAIYSAFANSLGSAYQAYAKTNTGSGNTGYSGGTGYDYNGAAGYNGGYGTAQGYTGYDNYYSSGQGNLDYAAMAAY